MDYTIPLNGWPKGVDNIHTDYELPQDALRRAVNVDIFDSGKTRRRRGSTLRTALVGAHSLWSDPTLAEAYYVAGTTLYSITKNMVSTAIVTGLMPGRPVAYLYLNGEVFWSNGIATGRAKNGVNTPWGIETPATTATLAATGGGLPVGTYQVVTTFKNAAGEESGAQNAQSITLAAVGGIAMTNLPTAMSASVTQQCVYVTSDNGDTLFKVATLPAAQTVYTISITGQQTVALRTQDLSPMPAGNIVAHRNGVIYVAIGPVIYHSEPLRYGLYNPAKNFFVFPSDVDIMLATPEGLHVCADKAYFISAPGTEDVAQTITLPYGGIRGTGTYLPQNAGVAWFSPKGQILARGAQVEATTEKQHVPGIMASGMSFVREQEGLKQIVTITRQTGTNPLEYTGA